MHWQFFSVLPLLKPLGKTFQQEESLQKTLTMPFSSSAPSRPLLTRIDSGQFAGICRHRKCPTLFAPSSPPHPLCAATTLLCTMCCTTKIQLHTALYYIKLCCARAASSQQPTVLSRLSNLSSLVIANSQLRILSTFLVGDKNSFLVCH